MVKFRRIPKTPQAMAGTSDKRNAVVRFTPHPPAARTQPASRPACRELPAELTYGCVDWFDYKNHPLKGKEQDQF